MPGSSGFDDETRAESTDGEYGRDGADTEFDRLAGILADGVVGAVSGLVGVALMTVALLVAESLGVFDWGALAAIARMFGVESRVPPVLFGYAIFVGHGMVTWPLLFAALESYLPGGRPPVRGVWYGTALWSGFVVAFYDGYAGAALAGYVATTLLAHWLYGFGLGAVFEYLTTRPDTLV